ncbi:hypothetical protein EIN_036460 [Entamoeba invadens IP1]|uniref:CCHC-type domain-containing protein n=1 Tax=Entamoeba invadens IP1 TaxID=370355 RepID=A0A0A1U1C1_ENTIV|nr:hypothetical protein EIN_036460 [Entamoeba invadens IP1]ELP86329.1 hypothetical protein EIN_036460 [Entamoeba invadens IP1]|eukprot:XP_004185675.1 hypothetical protein EIN_036460 [Entamoeba invadens IP1]
MSNPVCVRVLYKTNKTTAEIQNDFSGFEFTFFDVISPEQVYLKPRNDYKVEFRTEKEVDSAIAELSHARVFDGRRLFCAKDKKNNKCLILGRIPTTKTQEEVEKFLIEFKPVCVTFVQPLLDQKRCNIKVGLKDEKTAEKFIDEYNGKVIDGEIVEVIKFEVKDKKCFLCGKTGHISLVCPEKDKYKDETYYERKQRLENERREERKQKYAEKAQEKVKITNESEENEEEAENLLKNAEVGLKQMKKQKKSNLKK